MYFGTTGGQVYASADAGDGAHHPRPEAVDLLVGKADDGHARADLDAAGHLERVIDDPVPIGVRCPVRALVGVAPQVEHQREA